MSWKPEVIADNSGKWVGNGLLFATKEESDRWVAALANRWLLVRETRSVEVDKPATHFVRPGEAMAWNIDGPVKP